jgi:hypothetical protein
MLYLWVSRVPVQQVAVLLLRLPGLVDERVQTRTRKARIKVLLVLGQHLQAVGELTGSLQFTLGAKRAKVNTIIPFTSTCTWQSWFHNQFVMTWW